MSMQIPANWLKPVMEAHGKAMELGAQLEAVMARQPLVAFALEPSPLRNAFYDADGKELHVYGAQVTRVDPWPTLPPDDDEQPPDYAEYMRLSREQMARDRAKFTGGE